MKRLFKVELQRIVAVYADDEHEATDIAIRSEKKEIYNAPPDYTFVDEVQEIGELPLSWHSAIPLHGLKMKGLSRSVKRLLFDLAVYKKHNADPVREEILAGAE
jgi:hypothetical protein